ncbi:MULTISPECIES: HNH endonuclease [Bacillus]|uniref:HNH endonuclease n=2 Tax=Bacillaceae TaxID=186817 RepID=UPI002079E02A|nr:HNH endonuclease [Bacillus thuringiensis]USL16102.1 HNH endonuclease [Bacillus thuringiensis]
MGVLIVCQSCGVEKESRYKTTRFCSDKCRRKYNGKHRGHKQICQQCMKVFYEYKKRRCCSIDCRRIYENVNKKSKIEYIPKPKHIAICINCSKQYKTHVTNSKYCSYKCRYQYKVRQKVIHNIKCKECSKWFSSTNKRKLYCSAECNSRYQDRKKDTLRRNRIKQNGKVDWSISIERLMKRDKGICYLCSKCVDINLNPNHDYYPSIEHIIPVSKGGTHTWDNVKLAHRKCNYLKSNEMI